MVHCIVCGLSDCKVWWMLLDNLYKKILLWLALLCVYKNDKTETENAWLYSRKSFYHYRFRDYQYQPKIQEKKQNKFHKRCKVICMSLRETSVWALNLLYVPHEDTNHSVHHHGQDQRALREYQENDWRPAQGWDGLQDHQATIWCDY